MSRPLKEKVLAMYGRGMSQRDISSTIEDIYGFTMSHEQISHITDCILDEVHEWQNRPLLPFYPFLFVDCIYVSMRTERAIKQKAVYVITSDMTSMEIRISLVYGSMKQKANIPGCRSSMKSGAAASRMWALSPWMESVGLKKGPAHLSGGRCSALIVRLIRNSLRYIPWNRSREFEGTETDLPGSECS